MYAHNPNRTDDRKGAAAPDPELDLEAVQKYLGCYSTEEPDVMVEVIIHNDHLALEVIGQRTLLTWSCSKGERG